MLLRHERWHVALRVHKDISHPIQANQTAGTGALIITYLKLLVPCMNMSVCWWCVVERLRVRSEHFHSVTLQLSPQRSRCDLHDWKALRSIYSERRCLLLRCDPNDWGLKKGHDGSCCSRYQWVSNLPILLIAHNPHLQSLDQLHAF